MNDCFMVSADSGANWSPGEKHRGSAAGRPEQRGSAESGPVQALPPLPQAQHGALQGSPPAQVRRTKHKKPSLSFSVFSPGLALAAWKERRGSSTPPWPL